MYILKILISKKLFSPRKCSFRKNNPSQFSGLAKIITPEKKVIKIKNAGNVSKARKHLKQQTEIGNAQNRKCLTMKMYDVNLESHITKEKFE